MVKKISSFRRTTFYQFLQNQLGTRIPPELLPRRLRILGHVAILWLDPKILKYKSLIGDAVMKYNPKIRSVLRRTAAISGPYRQPRVELIAGSPETETIVKENKVIFHLDPMKVMFSLGNKAERVRMSRLGKDEFVVDMFAGIGQFSLPMAVHAHPTIIHAIEWNREAYQYLKQNIEVNKVSDILIPHFGDTRVMTPKVAQERADRIIMGLIQGTTKYLEQGVLSLRPGGILHIHEIGPRTDLTAKILSSLESIAQSLNRQIESLETHTIKAYNPQYTHFVLDAKIQ